MANTATAQTALPVTVGGHGPVIPVVVTMDTTGSDLTVYTPDSDKVLALVGITFAEGSANSLTIKSGSTTLVTLELTTFQGLSHKVGGGAILFTAKGEALKFNVGTAAVSTMIVYVVQAERFDFP